MQMIQKRLLDDRTTKTFSELAVIFSGSMGSWMNQKYLDARVSAETATVWNILAGAVDAGLIVKAKDNNEIVYMAPNPVSAMALDDAYRKRNRAVGSKKVRKMKNVDKPVSLTDIENKIDELKDMVLEFKGRFI